MHHDDILTDPSASTFTSKSHSDTYAFISPSKISLQGKYYLISGASKGIGKAMAISLASAGASGIACLARTSVASTVQEALAAVRQAGRTEPRMLQIKCDTTVPADVNAAAALVEEQFGRLDVLVNNAGAIGPWVPLVESAVDEWWRTWEVNVKGVYMMDRAFIPLLLKSPDGLKTIVTCSSAGGLVQTPTASAYQGTKAAVIRLNNHLTADYGEQGLVSYCIHPGGVPTELAHGMPEWMHHVLNDKPELAADALAWLTSQKRDWLADTYVSVKWDMEELEKKKDDIASKKLLRLKLRV